MEASVKYILIWCTLVAMLSSETHSAIPQFQNDLGVRQLPYTLRPPVYPALTVIEIILRQKCYEWMQQGLQPLPDWCYVLFRNITFSKSQLHRFYDSYSKMVTPQEKERDLQRAKDRIRIKPHQVAL